MKVTFSIKLALFAYGGNGGVASVIPEQVLWWAAVRSKLAQDPRISKIGHKIYSDTPIYMTRNQAVRDATEEGYDLLFMLDSDNEPDAYLGRDPNAEPFFGKPLDFVLERLQQGIPTVMMAPYCGPPPHPLPPPGIIDEGEVPYMFQWTNRESDSLNVGWHQRMLTRNEAERLTGLFPMSSGPTGVSLFTTNVFQGPPKPYFDYEHDADKTEKRGTEDCFATRNLSLYWKMTKGYDVLYAACDSWALHHKPKRVGKPRCATIEIVSQEMRDAILSGHSNYEKQAHVDFTSELKGAIQQIKDAVGPPDFQGLPRLGQTLRPDQDQVYLSDDDLEYARQLVELEKRAT